MHLKRRKTKDIRCQSKETDRRQEECYVTEDSEFLKKYKTLRKERSPDLVKMEITSIKTSASCPAH